MENTTLTRSEIEDAQALMSSQQVTVVKTAGTFGEYLMTGLVYQGTGFIVHRRKIDEIDNLYIERR